MLLRHINIITTLYRVFTGNSEMSQGSVDADFQNIASSCSTGCPLRKTILSIKIQVYYLVIGSADFPLRKT